MFMSGKIAMYGSGRWLIRNLQRIDKFQWGIAPLPRGRQRATVLSTISLMILRTTKYPEIAWKFVEHLASREAQVYFVRETSNLSILKELNVAVLEHEVPFRSEYNKVFLDEMSHARTMPQVKRYNEIFEITYRELDPVFLGMVSPTEGCRRAAIAINKILRE